MKKFSLEVLSQESVLSQKNKIIKNNLNQLYSPLEKYINYPLENKILDLFNNNIQNNKTHPLLILTPEIYHDYLLKIKNLNHCPYTLIFHQQIKLINYLKKNNTKIFNLLIFDSLLLDKSHFWHGPNNPNGMIPGEGMISLLIKPYIKNNNENNFYFSFRKIKKPKNLIHNLSQYGDAPLLLHNSNPPSMIQMHNLTGKTGLLNPWLSLAVGLEGLDKKEIQSPVLIWDNDIFNQDFFITLHENRT